MRDKLIELINSRRDPCDIGACPFTVDDVRPCSLCEAESLAEHLVANGVTFADVPETNVGKWIPVSERLPDPRCSIEMYFPSKEMVCLGFFEKVGSLNIWCVYTPNSANVCHINPTHWRYRAIVPGSPEPPKEGE